MKRALCLLMFLIFTVFARPAEAARDFFMGNLASNGTLCPVIGTAAVVLQTNVGYFTDPAEPYPKTGDIAYVRAFGANVSGCVNDVVGFEFFLPDGASLAISAAAPVTCYRGTLSGSIFEAVGNSNNSACSQNPSAGSNGGAFFGYDTVPSGWYFEIRVPVVFNKKLLGLAGPNSHRLSLATSSVYGTVFPNQPVTTFYNAELLNPVTTATTSTTADVAFDLKSYFNGGLLYIDFGTSTSFGSSTPAASVPNTSLSFSPTAQLNGLNPGTTYFWRARFATGDGTFTSATQSFTTAGSSGPTALAVTKNGTGAGTVSSSPTGINCGTTCSANFSSGTSVTLTATPATGSRFVGWSGDCAGSVSTCTVSMTTAKSVNAQFAREIGSLDITLSGLPTGTTAALGLTGPDGLNITYSLTTGTGIFLSDVVTGTYTINAPPITVGSTLYTAFTPTQSATVTFGGTATFAVSYRVGGPISVAAKPGDLNGDLKSDLVFNNTSTGEIAAWLMNGPSVTSAALLLGPGAWTTTHTADLNADGKADILLRNNSDGTVVLWLMNGLGVTSGTTLLSAGSGWSVSHTGDFNGDGKADILLRHTDGRIVLWLMNGGAVTSGTSLLPAGTGYSAVHVADFNGDGKADILLRNTSDGTLVLWTMNGGTVTAGATILSAGAGYTPTHTGDLDGDGKADILLRNNANGSIVAWLMNGATVTSGTTLIGASNWYVNQVADFNGDGKSDILLRNADGTIVAWLMNGSTVSSGSTLFGPTTAWAPTKTGDYNGDGKADIIMRNNDGTLVMWLMNGGAITSGSTILGPGFWNVGP
jgi:hypothetical protein